MDSSLLLPLALAALLIFFLFNSRRKQKARAEQIKQGLTPGATVMTTFGVFGTVLSIDEENNQVTIESGPGTVLRVHRQAIGQVESSQAAPAADAAAPADAPESDAAADAEKPTITDAELDAMNARKRAEQDSESADETETDEASASAGGETVADSAADTTEAEGSADDSADADTESSDSASTDADTDTDKKN